MGKNGSSSRDKTKENARKERLNKALRTNLQKRKQMSRQLSIPDGNEEGLATRTSALAPRIDDNDEPKNKH